MKKIIHLCIGFALFCAISVTSASSRSLPEFTDLVKKVGPAVVNISTVRKVKSGEMNNSQLEEFEGTPFYDFFKRFWGQSGMGMPGYDQEYDVRSLGSGFIIDSNGFIITNNHVIQDADEIIVRLTDHREFPAKLMGADEESDIALLKVDAKNLPTLSLSTETEPQVGEWVIAVGSPFGFDSSVTAGIISALGRSFDRERYVPFIQTDVAINPGNSGGPLINMDGNVIGVNSHIVTRSGQYAGLSFAIPADVVNVVLGQLKQNGKVTRGWLGLSFQPVTRELAQSFGLGRAQGALVAEVMPDTPAGKAGIQQGDVILKFNNEPIETADQLPHFVGRTEPGSVIEVEVYRNQKTFPVKVTIGSLPTKDKVSKEVSSTIGKNKLGLRVREFLPEDARKSNTPQGLLIDKVDQGPAQMAGLQPGDILLSLNQKPMKTVADFDKVVKSIKPGDIVAMLVAREGAGQRYIAIRIGKE